MFELAIQNEYALMSLEENSSAKDLLVSPILNESKTN